MRFLCAATDVPNPSSAPTLVTGKIFARCSHGQSDTVVRSNTYAAFFPGAPTTTKRSSSNMATLEPKPSPGSPSVAVNFARCTHVCASFATNSNTYTAPRPSLSSGAPATAHPLAPTSTLEPRWSPAFPSVATSSLASDQVVGAVAAAASVAPSDASDASVRQNFIHRLDGRPRMIRASHLARGARRRARRPPRDGEKKNQLAFLIQYLCIES